MASHQIGASHRAKIRRHMFPIDTATKGLEANNLAASQCERGQYHKHGALRSVPLGGSRGTAGDVASPASGCGGVCEAGKAAEQWGDRKMGMKPNIELHIEELVLHGVKPRHRHRIACAVERELTKLLTEQNFPAFMKGVGDIHNIDG